MSKRQIKLSFEKLKELLNKHEYDLCSVYSENSHVRFVECRTPKLQKTFIVYIPQKYSMLVGNSSNKLNIVRNSNKISAYQLEFLSDMKGLIVDCDLLAVSSDMIYMYHNDGKIYSYFIKDQEESDEDVELDSDKEADDNVSKLEKITATLYKKVKPNAKPPQIQNKEEDEEEILNTDEEEELASDDEEIVSDEEEVLPKKEESKELPPTKEEEKSKEVLPPKKEKEEVELIFEDENGDLVDDVKHTLDIQSTIPQENVPKKQSKYSGSTTSDNSLPSDIQNSSISLGVVYVVIDISVFFKKIDVYEDQIVRCYTQIDDNELDFRKDRFADIKEKTEVFLKRAEDRLKQIHTTEKEIKIKLLRLTAVFTQVKLLKDKIQTDPQKYKDSVDDSEDIYSKTRKIIHELNLERLQLRDEANELLYNYDTTIKELIEL